MKYFKLICNDNQIGKAILLGFIGLFLLIDANRGILGMTSTATILDILAIVGVESIISVAALIIALRRINSIIKNISVKLPLFVIFGLFFSSIILWGKFAGEYWHTTWDRRVENLVRDGISETIILSNPLFPHNEWTGARCSVARKMISIDWNVEYEISCGHGSNTKLRLLVNGDIATAWIYK
jgi:hypothetical protein